MAHRRFFTVVFCSIATAIALIVVPAAAGAATASPASLDFGPVPVGQTLGLQDVVTPDPGFSVLFALGAGGGLAAPWGFTFDSCNADSPCTVTESFSPTTTGPASATLTMVECPDAGGSCTNVPIALSGTGVTVGTGTMTAGPATVSPGDSISATSVTPCPSGTPGVNLQLFTSGGTPVRAGPATITDSSGDWAGALTVPDGVSGPMFITATCVNNGLTVQNYNDVAISVVPSATTTSLSTSGSPSDFGQPVTFTASVTGSGTPTGSVTFADGSTGLATVALTGGSAQLTISTLAVGSHHITASYSGSGASSSASLTQVVQRAPTTLVAATERRANPTAFSATLTSDGSPVAGKTVTFTTTKSFGGTVVQCSATTNGSGVATCTGKNAFSLADKRSYTAGFAGDANYFPASATGRLTS